MIHSAQLEREETKVTSPQVSNIKGVQMIMQLGEAMSNSSIEDL
jgi:hypothetical protein